MKTTGSIWPNRSSTPCSPKSGEQEDQTAPIEAAASMAATVSGMLGIMAAMRSPSLTPSETKSCCSRETSACNPSQERRRSTLSSPLKTMASRGPLAGEQVLGEIQARIGEEFRARHKVRILENAMALVADDAAKIPDQAPEILAVIDRPAVKLGIGREGRSGARGRGRHERRHRRRCDAIHRRGPEGDVFNHYLISRASCFLHMAPRCNKIAENRDDEVLPPACAVRFEMPSRGHNGLKCLVRSIDEACC